MHRLSCIDPFEQPIVLTRKARLVGRLRSLFLAGGHVLKDSRRNQGLERIPTFPQAKGS